MKYIKEYKELENKIANSNNIAIFWHDYVDWDCIWSMLWLGCLLEKIGKNITYHTSYQISSRFDRVPNINLIKTNFDYNDYDMIIFVDFNSLDRISQFNSSYFKYENTYIFDHHPWNAYLWAINIIDTNKSSACEVIWNFIDYIYSDLIDDEISTYLLLWVITDTGNFEYEKDSEETFFTVSEMIKKWADKKFISNNLLPKYNENYFNFLKIFINRITKISKIVYSYILLSDSDVLWSQDIDDLQDFRNFIRYYKWAELSIYITEIKQNILKFSMRSKSWIAWPIAGYFWWWWHPNAWSFQIKIKENQNIISKINTKISEINNLPIIS